MFDYNRAIRLNRKKLWMNVPWETSLCSDGTTCWCRRIVTKELKEEDGNDYEITGTGEVSKVEAKMMIQRHNIYIGRRRVLFEKTMML